MIVQIVTMLVLQRVKRYVGYMIFVLSHKAQLFYGGVSGKTHRNNELIKLFLFTTHTIKNSIFLVIGICKWMYPISKRKTVWSKTSHWCVGDMSECAATCAEDTRSTANRKKCPGWRSGNVNIFYNKKWTDWRLMCSEASWNTTSTTINISTSFFYPTWSLWS